MSEVVSVRGVCVTYPAQDGVVTALDPVTVQVVAGECLVVLGRSGHGKTTLINVMLGVTKPSLGQVRVLGQDPHLAGKTLRGRIGCAFQDDRLLPWRTVGANVALPLRIAGVAAAEAQERAAEWLARVGLGSLGGCMPGALSGGMRQRVALARAMAVDPSLLILDEPLSKLDVSSAAAMRALLRARPSGQAVVHVTHNIDEALALADRVMMIGGPRHGHIWASSPASRSLKGELVSALEMTRPSTALTGEAGLLDAG